MLLTGKEGMREREAETHLKKTAACVYLGSGAPLGIRAFLYDKRRATEGLVQILHLQISVGGLLPSKCHLMVVLPHNQLLKESLN